jgi:hypothetical protein
VKARPGQRVGGRGPTHFGLGHVLRAKDEGIVAIAFLCTVSNNLAMLQLSTPRRRDEDAQGGRPERWKARKEQRAQT